MKKYKLNGSDLADGIQLVIPSEAVQNGEARVRMEFIFRDGNKSDLHKLLAFAVVLGFCLASLVLGTLRVELLKVQKEEPTFTESLRNRIDELLQ